MTIAGRGSKLIGGSLQSELTRQEVEAIAVDGFFPATRRMKFPIAAQNRACTNLGCRSWPTRPCPSI